MVAVTRQLRRGVAAETLNDWPSMGPQLKGKGKSTQMLAKPWLSKPEVIKTVIPFTAEPGKTKVPSVI